MEPILNFAQLTAHLKKLNQTTKTEVVVVMVPMILTRNMLLPAHWKKELRSF